MLNYEFKPSWWHEGVTRLPLFDLVPHCSGQWAPSDGNTGSLGPYSTCAEDCMVSALGQSGSCLGSAVMLGTIGTGMVVI